jgi:hypothetical protein
MTAGSAIDTCVHAVAWVKADPPGAEFAEIQLESRRLHAKGVAIGVRSRAVPAFVRAATREGC